MVLNPFKDFFHLDVTQKAFQLSFFFFFHVFSTAVLDGLAKIFC